MVVLEVVGLLAMLLVVSGHPTPASLQHHFCFAPVHATLKWSCSWSQSKVKVVLVSDVVSVDVVVTVVLVIVTVGVLDVVMDVVVVVLLFVVVMVVLVVVLVCVDVGMHSPQHSCLHVDVFVAGSHAVQGPQGFCSRHVQAQTSICRQLSF